MKYPPFIFFFLLELAGSMVQNLMPNGGFEDYINLHSGYGQLYNARYWSNLNGNIWPLWPYGSPEYFHTFGSGGVRIPNASLGTVNPHSGNGIAGFIGSSPLIPDFREYVSSPLSWPMTVDSIYKISF